MSIDGETQEFNIKAPLIQAGTARVYLDGEELTEGTDFIVDYITRNSANHYGRQSFFIVSLDCLISHRI